MVVFDIETGNYITGLKVLTGILLCGMLLVFFLGLSSVDLCKYTLLLLILALGR